MQIKTLSELPAWMISKILLELADLNTGRRLTPSGHHQLVFALNDIQAKPYRYADTKPEPGSSPIQIGTAVMVFLPRIDEATGRSTGRDYSWHFDRMELPDGYEFPKTEQ